MGRRQLRLKSNHEIPKCLHGRQRRPKGTMHVFSIALAGANHLLCLRQRCKNDPATAPNTSSSIVSKSIAKDGGAVEAYRGTVRLFEKAIIMEIKRDKFVEL